MMRFHLEIQYYTLYVELLEQQILRTEYLFRDAMKVGILLVDNNKFYEQLFHLLHYYNTNKLNIDLV